MYHFALDIFHVLTETFQRIERSKKYLTHDENDGELYPQSSTKAEICLTRLV